MPSYKTFYYSENLSQRVFSQLPERLKVGGDGDPEILLIIRLLSGNLKLEHNHTSKMIKNRINYFSSDFVPYANWKKDFPKILSEDVTAEDISLFIDQTQFRNRTFYKAILSEISHFILHENKKSHTSAFIYIYRILEKISYAFPLIYSSKSQDFLQSFKQLKDLMVGDDEKKELGFFKTFVTMLYKDDSISETSIDIEINSTNEDVKKQMFNELKKVSTTKILHSDTSEPDVLSIKYCEMGSFIITVRNRFFHNLNGGSKNIESDKIVDSEELFSFINPMAMHWLSMIFLGVISYSLSEFQSHNSNTA